LRMGFSITTCFIALKCKLLQFSIILYTMVCRNTTFVEFSPSFLYNILAIGQEIDNVLGVRVAPGVF
jgi:hypothetical protein